MARRKGRQPKKARARAKGGRPESVSKRSRAVALARKTLREDPTSLGATPFRGLGKRGFGTLRKSLTQVRRARSQDIKRISYDVVIKKPDGTLHLAAVRQIIPEKRMSEVRRMMKIAKVSETEAVRRVMVREVQRFIFQSVYDDPELHRAMGVGPKERISTPELTAYLKGSAPEVIEKMQAAHRAQGYTYSVEFHVED